MQSFAAFLLAGHIGGRSSTPEKIVELGSAGRVGRNHLAVKKSPRRGRAQLQTGCRARRRLTYAKLDTRTAEACTALTLDELSYNVSRERPKPRRERADLTERCTSGTGPRHGKRRRSDPLAIKPRLEICLGRSAEAWPSLVDQPAATRRTRELAALNVMHRPG